mmetsp:Transcript_48582/g.113757  ORF Transcript_48582/g.113757 Transcript_48582/m.113757 type:complete len:90 (+) Transcript_48582:394-663(+)
MSISTNTSSVGLDLEGSVATVEGGDEGVTMYHDGDKLDIHIRACSAYFTKNGGVLDFAKAPRRLHQWLWQVELRCPVMSQAYVDFGWSE